MTLFEPKKARARRNEIRGEVRQQKPSVVRTVSDGFGALGSDRRSLTLLVAIVFAFIVASILMLRPRVVAYRPGDVTPAPIFSRVDFAVADDRKLDRARQEASDAQPRIYMAAEVDPFDQLRDELLSSPRRLTGLRPDQLSDAGSETGLARVLGPGDGAALARLQSIAEEEDATWPAAVERYTKSVRSLGLVLLPAEASRDEVPGATIQLADGRKIVPGGRMIAPAELADAEQTATSEEISRRVSAAAYDAFGEVIFPKIVRYTSVAIGPTVVPDQAATARLRTAAADRVPESAGEVIYRVGQRLLPAWNKVDEADWKLLRAENGAYRDTLGRSVWAERAGLGGVAVFLTAALSLYVVRFRPKIVANPVRAAGLAGLLLAAMLVSQLAALGTGNLVLLGIGPILLTVMTLCVAYDGRFALGVGGILSLLVTLALGEGIGFFFVAFSGVLPACFLLDEVRSRSRLIEVGGLVGAAAATAAVVAGLLAMRPVGLVFSGAAWAALSGFAAGGLVLCALPFIEKTFRITTGLTLLEYLDHPLLRRLAIEAPGTYNHSLQVATISEAAAKAIGADSLLCRVACYYHDVGKLRKPDYFIENQRSRETGDMPNPHLLLNPSMSLLVIIGHVKDGVAMAREWGLPRSFQPFIEEHHGTTLVEYFYREACDRQSEQLGANAPVAEGDYRYPGPKPRSRETAIIMLADACESACRAMPDPTPTRLESRVNDLAQKRLLDGQFADCPITIGELDRVRRSIIKSLVGIYHGRIQYPGDKSASVPTPAPGIPAAGQTVAAAG